MRLSEHFTLAELTITATGLPNIPDDAAIQALTTLCQRVLERIRNLTKRPIDVSSGFRCQAVDAAVAGPEWAKRVSQHRLGEAADFNPNLPIKTVVDAIIAAGIEFDQLILERPNPAKPGWIHISFTTRRPNRRQALAYVPVNGTPTYVAYDSVRATLDENGKTHGC